MKCSILIHLHCIFHCIHSFKNLPYCFLLSSPLVLSSSLSSPLFPSLLYSPLFSPLSSCIVFYSSCSGCASTPRTFNLFCLYYQTHTHTHSFSHFPDRTHVELQFPGQTHGCAAVLHNTAGHFLFKHKKQY